MIALDSDALALAVKGIFNRQMKTRSNVAEEQIRSERGQAYIRQLAQTGEPVMISAVSLGEYLVLFPPTEHARELTALKDSGIRVYPVDERAAFLAARIRRATLADKELAKAYSERKRLLKLDAFVLAVAIVNEAQQLVSYDTGIKSLAETAIPGKIKVIQFPVVSELQFDPPAPKISGEQPENPGA